MAKTSIREQMKGFLYYLVQMASRGVALALAGLGLVGETVRLIASDFPVPRWVDLILLTSGIVWGGYVVYRDKPPPETPLLTGPTPISRFYSSLSTLPRHLPMGELVIGYAAQETLRFTEAEFDAIDVWISSLSPESVPSRSDRSFIRRQVKTDDVLISHVQVDPPGPVVSIDKVISVHEITEGTAADVQELYDFWALVRDELPRLSGIIGAPPLRIAVALQPYPSEGGPIVDLWFGELPQPNPSGEAGNVIPWQEIFEASDAEDLTAFPERAARTLLRHFGYRGVEETLGALYRQP